jgi:hypothetical protein
MTVSNYFKVLVLAAAMAVVALVLAAEPARAAFPGANGKIIFD